MEKKYCGKRYRRDRLRQMVCGLVLAVLLAGCADGQVAGDGADADAGGPEAAEDAGKALVYYSLGNFVNWTSETGEGVANRMVGGMARVTIGRDDAGRAVIKDYAVEPLVCHVEQGFGGVRVYPLSEYTEELAAGNEIVSQDGSFSYDYCASLAEEVFGDMVNKGYGANASSIR